MVEKILDSFYVDEATGMLVINHGSRQFQIPEGSQRLQELREQAVNEKRSLWILLAKEAIRNEVEKGSAG